MLSCLKKIDSLLKIMAKLRLIEPLVISPKGEDLSTVSPRFHSRIKSW